VHRLTDEEHPLPAFETISPFHSFVHSRHHDTREHASQLPNGREDGRSLRDFGWFAERHVSHDLFGRMQDF
jgi:hypothetical protein